MDRREELNTKARGGGTRGREGEMESRDKKEREHVKYHQNRMGCSDVW